MNNSSIGIAPSGDIFVYHSNSHKIYRIFPGNHTRQEVSDLQNSLQGPAGKPEYHITITPNNHILLLGTDVIISLDPSTGHRRVLSDYLNPAQGNVSTQSSKGISTSVDRFGRIIYNVGSVVDFSCLSVTNPIVDCNDILRMSHDQLIIDETTGNRTIGRTYTMKISGKVLVSPDVQSPTGIRIPGEILTDTAGNSIQAWSRGGFYLFHAHDENGFFPGYYTFISDANDVNKGSVLRGEVFDFTLDKTSNLIYFLESFSSVNPAGLLYSLDANTGVRTLVSDFNNPAQGALAHITNRYTSSNLNPNILVVGVMPAFTGLQGGGNPGGGGSVPVNPSQTPAIFSFKMKKKVAPGALAVSSRAKINGIKDGSAPISVVGGKYAILCKKFTAKPSVVKNGQTVCVSHRAAKKRKTQTTTTLTVGGASAVFTSVTK